MRRARTRFGEQEAAGSQASAPARAGAARSPESPSGHGDVLLLQRLAGNRAVGTLLARETKKAAKSGSGDKAGAADKPAGTTLVMPDPIGVLPVEAFQIGANGSELAVTLPSSAADAQLADASTNGKLLGTVTLSTAGLSFTITDAMISSMQTTSGHTQISINGQIKRADPTTTDAGSAGGTPETPSYDLETTPQFGS